MKKPAGPNLAKWKDFRLGILTKKEQLDEGVLGGVFTTKPININSQENQAMARRSVEQIERDLAEVQRLLKIAKSGLNEGNVPDSKTGHQIMELAMRIGAVAGKMWK